MYVPATLPVAIAHLSDIHIGPLVGLSPRFWNTKRALGFLNWHRKRRFVHRSEVADRLVADLAQQPLDHVAVSGDLANLGLPAEHERALAWLAKLGPPDRVSVVPGNHDIYAELGGDQGPMRWLEFMQSDVSDEPLTSAASFPFVRRIGRIALIGINSAVPTPPAIAIGRVGAEQRARLGSMLERLGADGYFRLVMIHHPPLPGHAKAHHELEDAAEVERILVAHGAELVIHGHNHTSTTAWRQAESGRPIAIVGVPSGSAARSIKGEPLARYHIYRIAPDAGSWRIDLEARGIEAPDGAVVPLGKIRLAAPIASHV